MRWYARSRNLQSVATATALALVIAAASGSSRVPVPSLIGGAQVGMPFASLAPLIILLAAGPLVAAAAQPNELVAARPSRVFDVGCAILVVALFAGATVVGWRLLGESTLLSASRNLAGLLGATLIVNHCFGIRAAMVAPPTWLLGSTLVGAGQDGDAQWWAWPIAKPEDLGASVCAAVLLAIGLAVHLIHPRHRT